MPIYDGIDELQECQCGRATLPHHCIQCGMTGLHCSERKARYIRIEDPNDPKKYLTQKLRAFKCYKCGKLFYEDERCVAPPVGKKAKLRVLGIVNGAPAEDLSTAYKKIEFLKKMAQSNPNFNLDEAIKSVMNKTIHDGNIPLAGKAKGEYHDDTLTIGGDNPNDNDEP